MEIAIDLVMTFGVVTKFGTWQHLATFHASNINMARIHQDV
jgi:hypothetical protein